MNRTDRLYELVEELRAVAPEPRSARQLAERHQVSTRTIERDLTALQRAGVPVHPAVGRRGRYALDRATTVPPLDLTSAEAAAIAVLLARSDSTPFARAARSALQKVLAAMPGTGPDSTGGPVGGVRLAEPAPMPDGGPPTGVVQEAVATHRVLRLVYTDRVGVATARTVEPVALASVRDHWYLIAWCRLRGDTRGLRLDRISAAEPTGETAPVRRLEDATG